MPIYGKWSALAFKETICENVGIIKEGTSVAKLLKLYFEMGQLLAEYFGNDMHKGLRGEDILRCIGFSIKENMNQDELKIYLKMVDLAIEYVVMIMNVIMFSPDILEFETRGRFKFKVNQIFGGKRFADKTGLMLLEDLVDKMKKAFKVDDGLFPCNACTYNGAFREALVYDKKHGYVFFDGYETLKACDLPPTEYVKNLLKSDVSQKILGEGVKVYARNTIAPYDPILTQRLGIFIRY